jgi:hypothetical protein
VREQIVDAAAAGQRLTKRERIERARGRVDSAALALDAALARYRVAESRQLATQHLARIGGASDRDVDIAKAQTLERVQVVGDANAALCEARRALSDARAARRRDRR